MAHLFRQFLGDPEIVGVDESDVLTANNGKSLVQGGTDTFAAAGDYPRFYAAVRRLGATAKALRDEALRTARSCD